MIYIFILAFIIRFAFLGSIPPSLPEVFSGRLVSAISGFLSIVAIYFLTKRLFESRKLAFFTSLSLTLLPISIIENRIVSWVSVAVFLVIISYFFIIEGRVYKKIIGYFLFSIFILYLNQEILLFARLLKNVDFTLLLNNFFDLLSFQKIFFANDTFWTGGIRRSGMIYPEAIPIFLIGIYEMLNKKQYLCLIFGLLVIFIAALSPTYPEAREIGLLIPVFSLILGFGSFKMFNYFKKHKRNALIMVSGLAYIVILFYGFINFFHYYFTHYHFEVKQENFYQLNKF